MKRLSPALQLTSASFKAPRSFVRPASGTATLVHAASSGARTSFGPSSAFLDFIAHIPIRALVMMRNTDASLTLSYSSRCSGRP